MTHVIKHTSVNGRVELPNGYTDVTRGPKRLTVAYTPSILDGAKVWDIAELSIAMSVERLGQVSEYVKVYDRVDLSRVPSWAMRAAMSAAPR